MMLGGLMTGAGYLAQTGDSSEMIPLLAASLSMFLGLVVLATFTAALVGVSARRSIGAWAAVAVCVVVGLLAETLDLPQEVRNLSPFEHVPALPAEAFDAAPMLVLAALAGTFLVIALQAFGRRDIG